MLSHSTRNITAQQLKIIPEMTLRSSYRLLYCLMRRLLLSETLVWLANEPVLHVHSWLMVCVMHKHSGAAEGTLYGTFFFKGNYMIDSGINKYNGMWRLLFHLSPVCHIKLHSNEKNMGCIYSVRREWQRNHTAAAVGSFHSAACSSKPWLSVIGGFFFSVSQC